QPVARVVVGRHRLGVAVHHHRVEAGVAQGEAGVHAAVVELDALPDAIRPRPEYHDGRTLAGDRLVLVLVGRVVVGRLRLELGAARVDGLERGRDTGFEPAAPDLVFGDRPQPRLLGVGEAQASRPPPLG